jgi:hypothetical protein
MAGTEPSRVTTVVPTQQRDITPSDLLRTFLWGVVVTSTVVNMVASYRGASLWVHLVCGTVTALGGGALVVARLQKRW